MDAFDKKLRRIRKQRLITITRKVKENATVSISSKLYSVPERFIGQTVEIKYPYLNPQCLAVWEHNSPSANCVPVQEVDQ